MEKRTVLALGAKDGMLRWQQACITRCDTFTLINDGLYLQEICPTPSSSCGQPIEALNANDGTQRWRQVIPIDINPVLTGTANQWLGRNAMLFVISYSGQVVGLFANTGKQVWYDNLHFAFGQGVSDTTVEYELSK